MSQPSVSVIMPVYNTEAYVAEAIESVLSQTLTDWELILINDGSTDNSLNVLKRFEQSDRRISLINQINQGVSAARNAGISNAKGRYIYFIDSDDEILPNTLQTCLDYCDNFTLDFVFFDAKLRFESGVKASENDFRYVREKVVPYSVSSGMASLLQLIGTDEYTVSPCLIFTSSSYIRENAFLFLQGIIHEDELFTTKLYLFATRVMYLPHQFFIRRIRNNSIMTSPIKRFNIDSYFVVAERLEDISAKRSEYKEVIDQYLTKLLNAVIWKAHVLPFTDRMAIFWIAMINWFSYIDFKSWIVLFVKKYLPKK